jgi:hypothetical protein
MTRNVYALVPLAQLAERMVHAASCLFIRSRLLLAAKDPRIPMSKQASGGDGFAAGRGVEVEQGSASGLAVGL